MVRYPVCQSRASGLDAVYVEGGEQGLVGIESLQARGEKLVALEPVDEKGRGRGLEPVGAELAHPQK